MDSQIDKLYKKSIDDFNKCAKPKYSCYFMYKKQLLNCYANSYYGQLEEYRVILYKKNINEILNHMEKMENIRD